jgi:hypothetical protein
VSVIQVGLHWTPWIGYSGEIHRRSSFSGQSQITTVNQNLDSSVVDRSPVKQLVIDKAVTVFAVA